MHAHELVALKGIWGSHFEQNLLHSRVAEFYTRFCKRENTNHVFVAGGFFCMLFSTSTIHSRPFAKTGEVERYVACERRRISGGRFPPPKNTSAFAG